MAIDKLKEIYYARCKKKFIWEEKLRNGPLLHAKEINPEI